MKIYVIVLPAALSVAATYSSGRAADCVSQFSAEEHQVYSSLSTDNQHILSTEIKTKNGETASCDFQRGLLDILSNTQPAQRNANFKQLVDKMLNHQQ
jgi:hypothetical protein